jgi:hypothetical protein
MMSGLIFKKMPEAGMLFCSHSSCAPLQFQDSESSGGAGFLRIYELAASTLYDPFPQPESKRK